MFTRANVKGKQTCINRKKQDYNRKQNCNKNFWKFLWKAISLSCRKNESAEKASYQEKFILAESSRQRQANEITVSD